MHTVCVQMFKMPYRITEAVLRSSGWHLWATVIWYRLIFANPNQMTDYLNNMQPCFNKFIKTQILQNCLVKKCEKWRKKIENNLVTFSCIRHSEKGFCRRLARTYSPSFLSLPRGKPRPLRTRHALQKNPPNRRQTWLFFSFALFWHCFSPFSSPLFYFA